MPKVDDLGSGRKPSKPLRSRHSTSRNGAIIDAVESTLALLHENPGIGRPYDSDHPRLRGLRIFRVEGFPNHLVFYSFREGDLVFVHLLHAARDLPVVLHEDLGL